MPSKDAGTLYFTTDTKRVYKGDEPYTPLLTERGPNKDGFSAWTVQVPTGLEPATMEWDSTRSVWVFKCNGLDYDAEEGNTEDSVSVSASVGAFTATRTVLPGYQLGTQSDKPLATAEQGAKADTAIQGIKVNGTTKTPDDSKVVDVSVPRVFYGTCGTSSGTTNKTVTCDNFTSNDFVSGTVLLVKFTNYNTSTTPSITIGG